MGATGFRGKSRNFGRRGWALETEFLEAGAEGVGVEVEEFGGAAGAVDDPVRFGEDGENMVVFDGFQGGFGTVWDGFGTDLGGFRRGYRGVLRWTWVVFDTFLGVRQELGFDFEE